MTKQEWIEEIKKMSVLELHELVKAIEEEFDVSAAAPMAMGMMAAPAAAAEAAEEPTEFSVELTSSGEQKIQVIKVVRQLTSLGLKEAKALVDEAPSVVKDSCTKEEAETIKSQLEEAGGQVAIKAVG
jgi:large subunit ribosomal protein L7/L12